jgi:hypothetical protein
VLEGTPYVINNSYSIGSGGQQTVTFETGAQTFNDLREFAEQAYALLDDETI